MRLYDTTKKIWLMGKRQIQKRSPVFNLSTNTVSQSALVCTSVQINNY